MKMAAANVEVARVSGVDAGVLSPTRTAVTDTRDYLAISMAALKSASDEHSRAREKSHHALEFGMCAAGAMDKFIEDDEGSLEKTERDRAGEMRDTQDDCTAEFDRLDAEIAELYHFETALSFKGGELDFVRDRYEVLVRKQEDLIMAVADFVCKVESDADSDWSQEEAPDSET